MKSLIKEIRNQPDHIRELIAGICTVVVVAFVGMIWFVSFKRTTYALLNPGQDQSTEASYASDSTSLFGEIGKAVKDGAAQISGFFGGSGPAAAPATSDTTTQSTATHPLPVEGNR